MTETNQRKSFQDIILQELDDQISDFVIKKNGRITKTRSGEIYVRVPKNMHSTIQISVRSRMNEWRVDIVGLDRYGMEQSHVVFPVSNDGIISKDDFYWSLISVYEEC